jgi:hypothetical protein
VSLITDIAGSVISGGVGPITSAIQGLGGSIADIIKRFIPDPDLRIQAETEIAKATQASIGQLAQASADVMKADAASDAWYTRAARPIVVYWSLVTVTGIAVLAPFGYADAVVSALSKVPVELWNTMTWGVGIFAGGRTAEKIATTVVKAIKK